MAAIIQMEPPVAQRSTTTPEMMVGMVAVEAHLMNHPATAMLGMCPLERLEKRKEKLIAPYEDIPATRDCAATIGKHPINSLARQRGAVGIQRILKNDVDNNFRLVLSINVDFVANSKLCAWLVGGHC